MLAFSGGDGTVLAAGPGRLYRFCGGPSSDALIEIIHPDGSATEYYQLRAETRAADGSLVTAGTYLGKAGTSLACGEAMPGPGPGPGTDKGAGRKTSGPLAGAVSFAVIVGGGAANLNGLTLGGWTFHQQADPPLMWAQRAAVRVTLGGLLKNFGATAPGAPTPGPTPAPIPTPSPRPSPSSSPGQSAATRSAAAQGLPTRSAPGVTGRRRPAGSGAPFVPGTPVTWENRALLLPILSFRCETGMYSGNITDGQVMLSCYQLRARNKVRGFLAPVSGVMAKYRVSCHPLSWGGCMSARSGQLRDRQYVRGKKHVSRSRLIISVTVIVVFAAGTAAGDTKTGERIADAAQRFLTLYSGVFALVALTMAVAAGLIATDRIMMSAGNRIVAQAVHRAIAFVSVAFLVTHIAMEIVVGKSNAIDSVVPFLAHGRTFYVGLGTIASDLVVLLVATGIARKRFAEKSSPFVWRFLHGSAYLAWPLSIVHGLVAGRHPKPYVSWSYGACLIAVGIALVLRSVATVRPRQATAHAWPDDAASPTSAAASVAAQTYLLHNQRAAALARVPSGMPAGLPAGMPVLPGRVAHTPVGGMPVVPGYAAHTPAQGMPVVPGYGAHTPAQGMPAVPGMQDVPAAGGVPVVPGYVAHTPAQGMPVVPGYAAHTPAQGMPAVPRMQHDATGGGMPAAPGNEYHIPAAGVWPAPGAPASPGMQYTPGMPYNSQEGRTDADPETQPSPECEAVSYQLQALDPAPDDQAR